MRAAGQRAAQLAAALVLALACGGGGGSGGAEDTTPAGPQFFDVSGEIRVAFATAVDSDVNDSSAPYAPNDTPATAQELGTPVTLGGYANVPGAGPPGRPGAVSRSLAIGDVHDYFRVSLAEGQTVRLFMSGDGISNDLDLTLEDESGIAVDASDTNTPVESVVAPAAGEYVIEVEAWSGFSSYVLSIGQATSIASRPPDFVPGEVIVRYRDGTSARGARRAADAATTQATELGLARGAGGSEGPQLLVGRDTSQLDAALRAVGKEHLSERARERRGMAVAQDVRARDAALRRDTRRLAKALRSQAGVASADLNYVRRASAVPSDPLYPLQWHYPQVWLPEAWDLVDPDSGVVVAVIDTGVKLAHPDLQGQLVQGYDFIQDLGRANDNNGCDANPDDPGDLALPQGRSTYHGTHVAGTVVAAASLGGAPDEGGTGVAWNAKVMPLRVLGVGGGTDFDLIQALRYAARLPNSCNALPAARADVVNMSLGGADPSTTLDAALVEVKAAGLVLVAAAGNADTSAPSYPAASPGVISVSAVDVLGRLAPYSNFGPTIDIAAPGGDMALDDNDDGRADGVLSTLVDGGQFVYGYYQGTSMAAPHVAGVVALMLGANPLLEPDDIDALLENDAMSNEDIVPPNFFGHGLLDAFEAVSAAIAAEGGEVPDLPPRLTASPGALNFGSQGTQAAVTLANDGGSQPPLTVGSFEEITDDGGDWLSVQPPSPLNTGLGLYTVSVSRTGLSNGVYTGAVRFHSSAGDLDVPVILQVGEAFTADADAGYQYLLLVDPEEISDTIESLEAVAIGGVYRFHFVDVPAGRYYLYAGSDPDNDFRICEPSESCGSYPTLNQPAVLDVQGNMQGVDFLTGFGLRIGATSTGASAPGSGLTRPAPPVARALPSAGPGS